MFRTRSDRRGPARLAAAAFLLLGVPDSGLGLVRAGPVAAQAQDRSTIASSQISLSRDEAALNLELSGGRNLSFVLQGGQVSVNGENRGSYARGDALDRSWRDLLNRAMEVPTAELLDLLVGWQAPDGVAAGEQLDRQLEAALAGVTAASPTAPSAPATQDATPPPPERVGDSLSVLRDRVAELEEELREAREEGIGAGIGAVVGDHVAREIRAEIERELRAELRREARRDNALMRPLRHIGNGIAGILSTLAMYAVLVGLGFAAVFFGRRYLEGVADTARHATVRSGLVGLAASFLVLPIFILGVIALAVSVVGIPLLLAWVPLFPVGVFVAFVFGYLAVAHAAGEALAERRFYGGEWFRRANSYYYVMTGLGLLTALFLAAQVIQMAGPWLGFLHGMLVFLGVVLCWAALTIGMGAVLLSRAGTRPLVPRPAGEPETGDILGEESHV